MGPWVLIRESWYYLSGAVRPATGERFALVLPVVSTEAMKGILRRRSERRRYLGSRKIPRHVDDLDG